MSLAQCSTSRDFFFRLSLHYVYVQHVMSSGFPLSMPQAASSMLSNNTRLVLLVSLAAAAGVYMLSEHLENRVAELQILNKASEKTESMPRSASDNQSGGGSHARDLRNQHIVMANRPGTRYLI